MIRVVHLTDLHFQCLNSARWSQLFGKRAIGAFNLSIVGRGRHFDENAANRAISAASNVGADIAVLTGDFTSMALPDEFRRAASSLSPLLESQPSMVMPGNHDVYTRPAYRSKRFQQYFGHWMAKPLDDRIAEGLRVLRCRNISVLSMDSCIPTVVGSYGRVPELQLQQLEQVLNNDEMMGEHKQKMVLALHYPVVDSAGRPYHEQWPWHALSNGDRLVNLLQRAKRKPVLVIHGHIHTGFTVKALGTLVANPGASGYALHDGKRAAFNVYDIDESSGHIDIHRYVDSGEADGGFMLEQP